MQSPSEKDVLSASAMEVARWIKARKLSSKDAVSACVKRIEAVNPTLNAVVWKRYDAALEDARRIDAMDDAARAELPLAGVPFTVKEFFAVEGAPWTGGIKARRNLIADADAPTVARLRKAGAIPLGTTNVPEGGLWFETHNAIYGRTNNPWDLSRTPGGSSGGEGAIIAAGGSVFGLGSDIGGSVRLPAAFCGIASHKATGRLVPNSGQFPAPRSEALAMLLPGPMAKRASDLMPLLEILVGPDAGDPYCVESTLQQPASVDLSKLTVWLARDNGRTPAEAVMKVAVEDSAKRLERAGATIREFDKKKLARGMEIWGATLGELEQDAYEEILASGSDKPRISLTEELALFAMGRANHTFAALAIGGAGSLLQKLTGKTGKKLYEKGQSLKAEFSELLGPHGVLLMPPFPCPAPKHHAPWRKPFSAAYTALFNVLETPASVVPVGFDRRGLPITVQIIGARHRDHVCLAVAEFLDREFSGWVLPHHVSWGSLEA